MAETLFTPEEDAIYLKRLLREYDGMIRDIEDTMANGVGHTFAHFLTAEQGKLMVAALRLAKQYTIDRATPKEEI